MTCLGLEEALLSDLKPGGNVGVRVGVWGPPDYQT